MSRQQRRAAERRQSKLGNLVSHVTNGMKIAGMGFFYKGDGVTVQDPESLIATFEDAMDGYRESIDNDPKELENLYHQLDLCKPLIANNTIDQQSGIIWMMNIYCLTRLGYIKDDNMNGLQYFYSR